MKARVMFDVERAIEDRATDKGWQPAAFALTCADLHDWSSEGRYHAEHSWHEPRHPSCPRRACGLPWAISSATLEPGGG